MILLKTVLSFYSLHKKIITNPLPYKRVWCLILCVKLTEPWCPVKHHSGHFCGGAFFGWDSYLKQWTLNKADYPHNVDEPHLISWRPLIEQIARRIPPADCLWTQTAALPESSACWSILHILDLQSLHSCISQFLKINR